MELFQIPTLVKPDFFLHSMVISLANFLIGRLTCKMKLLKTTRMTKIDFVLLHLKPKLKLKSCMQVLWLQDRYVKSLSSYFTTESWIHLDIMQTWFTEWCLLWWVGCLNIKAFYRNKSLFWVSNNIHWPFFLKCPNHQFEQYFKQLVRQSKCEQWP